MKDIKKDKEQVPSIVTDNEVAIMDRWVVREDNPETAKQLRKTMNGCYRDGYPVPGTWLGERLRD